MRFLSIKGLVPFDKMAELQKRLVDLRSSGAIDDTVLFLEHEPVITHGRGLQQPGVRAGHFNYVGRDISSRFVTPTMSLPDWIEYSETERGGGLTYHGPGQLVIYPIIKLNVKSIAAYLRKLERIVVEEVASYGLENVNARLGATGVWVGERKIASIGIAVTRWTSFHGIAINVVNELDPFYLISPCGFDPSVMTRLFDLLSGQSQTQLSLGWRRRLESSLARRFAREFSQAS